MRRRSHAIPRSDDQIALSMGGDVPTVIIVDDHPVVLHGLRDLLSRSCRVLAACGDGATALDAIRELGPDVVVLDIAMPGLDGIEVLRRLRAEENATAVLFLTAGLSDDEAAEALALGASGLLLKESVADGLGEQVARAARGEVWLAHWVEEAIRRSAVRRAEAERVRQLLTPREREILALLTRDLSNKELARQLALSEGTIKIHLHNIYEKLDIANRTRLVELALSLRTKRTAD